MSAFERLEEGIYRLKIPFENIYTSVFLLVDGGGCILVDGGGSPSDAETYVIPALQGVGMRPSLVLRSHCHGDHSGGVERIAREYGAKIGLMEDDFPKNGNFLRVYDKDMLLNRFQALHLKGHTDECLALLDTKTNALLSFDCLQVGGIDKYGVSFTDKEAYLQSVARVRALKVRRIIASHDFLPYGFQAQGEKRVAAYLDECEKTQKTDNR